MGNLIKSTVLTQNGECTLHITLDLNINLNSGDVSISTRKNVKENQEDTNVKREIPDFTPTTERIKFGKKG